MPGPIPRLGKSDPANLATMEHVAATANTGNFFSASGDMEAHATPSGRAILRNAAEQVFDRRMAVIGQSSFTDARYRLQVVAILRSSLTGGAPPTPDAAIGFQLEHNQSLFPEGGNEVKAVGTGDVGNWITATNLAEVIDWTESAPFSTHGTHLLIDETGASASSFVEVFCVYDDELDPRPHWFFCRPPPEVIPVTLLHDGGVDATGGLGPTYTYSITYRGVVLNTGQTPKGTRFGVTTALATFGYAHIDPATKRYVLGWANEAPGTTTCT